MADQYDAIVIGSGAGGAAAAYALTQKGLQVLILESGPRFDPQTDFRLDRKDWELRRFPEKSGSQGQYSFPTLQALTERWKHLRSWNSVSGHYVHGPNRIPSGPGYYHAKGIGGSTLRFTGESHRLNPKSMKMHSDFGVAADWPVTYSDLLPYYVEAESLIGVAGDKNPKGRGFLGEHIQPAHPLSDDSRLLLEKTKQSQWHWQANQRAALSQPKDDRPACNYCNNCNRGCPREDKGSADVTFIRTAQRSNRLTTKTGATVLQLLTDNDRTITSVLYADNRSQHHQISAPLIVLAAGAIETPRLLLNSANSNSPDGLANESGEVGKNFLETLSWNSTGISEAPIESFKGLPSDLISWQYNAPNSIPGVIGGCRFSTSTGESDLVGPVNYAQRLVTGWGYNLKQSMRAQFGRAISVSAIGESLPNPKSFISLDASKKDQHGLAIAQISSFLAETELARLDFMARSCRSILAQAGIKEIREEVGSYDLFSSTHVFGTCRMGLDANSSVTDASGISHRWRNLMICDASLFPSSGGGESPSLTIQSLALRNIDLWIKLQN